MVDAPEILTVIGKIPCLTEFLNDLYGCQYKSFFSAFGEDSICITIFVYVKFFCLTLSHTYIMYIAGLADSIKLDRYLHPHFRYYMREVRVVVYSQFLEPYKSVTIEAMAKAFGVNVDFIDL